MARNGAALLEGNGGEGLGGELGEGALGVVVEDEVGGEAIRREENATRTDDVGVVLAKSKRMGEWRGADEPGS